MIQSLVFRYAAIYILGLLGGGAIGVIATSGYYNQAIDKQKIEAANVLVAETAKVITAERKQKELTDALEKQHDEAKDEIDAQHSDNLRLASELKRLREQRRRESGAGTVSETGRAATVAHEEAEAATVSETGEDDLVELGFDADEVAVYAQTCYDWIQQRKSQ